MDGWERVFAVAGAALALIAVALGAFGAHALQTRLDERALEIFETGVRYQTSHALALVLLAALLPRLHTGLGVGSGIAFSLGILVFSGSLYLLVGTGVSRWGAVTPIGGAAFLIGWLLLILAVLRG
jgi:uncharacterized membrane protein YgdD (TMEM256/DUF423 family)